MIHKKNLVNAGLSTWTGTFARAEVLTRCEDRVA
jgi:hypothetical protein